MNVTSYYLPQRVAGFKIYNEDTVLHVAGKDNTSASTQLSVFGVCYTMVSTIVSQEVERKPCPFVFG